MKKLNAAQQENVNGGLAPWYCDYINAIIMSGGTVYHIPIECWRGE